MKTHKDAFNQDILLMHRILLGINYPEKENLSWSTSFDAAHKLFAFEKHRALSQAEEKRQCLPTK
jgi:hypothetical protein